METSNFGTLLNFIIFKLCFWSDSQSPFGKSVDSSYCIIHAMTSLSRRKLLFIRNFIKFARELLFLCYKKMEKKSRDRYIGISPVIRVGDARHQQSINTDSVLSASIYRLLWKISMKVAEDTRREVVLIQGGREWKITRHRGFRVPAAHQ